MSFSRKRCHFTPYNVPVNNGQSVPPVYGQDVPPINGQNVPPSTSFHPPTILPAKNNPEGTWQEKGKRLWTFMHFCNIYGPGSAILSLKLERTKKVETLKVLLKTMT
jgi:hypothetical protein